MKPLTLRQAEILGFVMDFFQKAHRQPTLRQIGEAHGMSFRGAFSVLRSIERKGYITRQKGKRGSLVVLRDVHGQPVRLSWEVIDDVLA